MQNISNLRDTELNDLISPLMSREFKLLYTLINILWRNNYDNPKVYEIQGEFGKSNLSHHSEQKKLLVRPMDSKLGTKYKTPDGLCRRQ